eukprot:TRINITY_DN462_c0_g1_i1.p5 TRINITY_DN462_c0_g1~~TRINITY_DN462_c0_g1_i1.p5  ORF type:complete len:143 (-),score=27.24 TRINITY_DN462_c0_g1_i1:1646-2074(-)
MSVKSNLKDVEENIKEVFRDLESDSKEARRLRADYGILEHEIVNDFNTCLTELMRDISKLQGTLKKVVQEDVSETSELKQQVTGLIKEKIILQENVLHVASSVASTEEIVGCVPNVKRHEEMNAEYIEPDEDEEVFEQLALE